MDLNYTAGDEEFRAEVRVFLAAHHFKRLTMIELTLGDADHHLERFVAQPRLREAA